MECLGLFFITVKKMVKLTPQQLDNIEREREIVFQVGDDDVATAEVDYRSTLRGIANSCTGVEAENLPTSIDEIPLTKNNGVYIIHVVGEYEGFHFNHRLMGMQETNYFLAVKGDKGWEEVKFSPKPIEGAKCFGFRGSYVELGTDGLTEDNVRVGYHALVTSLMSLVKGKGTVKDFLTVCVNLFEPVRYPLIGEVVIQPLMSVNPFDTTFLEPTFITLIYYWSALSTAVRRFKKTKVWVFDANDIDVSELQGSYSLEQEELPQLPSTVDDEIINDSNVHSYLGMALRKNPKRDGY